MTGGSEIKFGGARKVYLCEFERSREIYSSVDQTYKVKTKKKRSSSQKFYEIRCESTKITKIRAVNTNLGVLGLDLHSNSPESVNFLGAQSSLFHDFRLGEGHKQSFGGARRRNAPTWRRACILQQKINIKPNFSGFFIFQDYFNTNESKFSEVFR